MTLGFSNSQIKQLFLFIAAALIGASVWFYFQQVLIPYDTADAIARQRPRGNLSDLYPRWLGARELLLHHRNPYGDDISLEIQKGYYGRVLDPTRPNDPKDQQRFAYPVYVVFLLAPMIRLPFHEAQVFFFRLSIVLTAASVWLWLRALRWRLPPLMVAACIVLTLGSIPAAQGIKLQQLSLLVAALLAGSAECVERGFLFCGGVLLALATIKPQLAWPLLVWLLVWAVSEWRHRRRLVFGFATMMALLLIGAEVVLPGWWQMFGRAMRQYIGYTQSQSVLDMLSPWGLLGKALSGIAVLACGFLLWKLRREAADTVEFGRAIALVMVLTVLVVPMYAPYNQILLLPAILVLIRDRAFFASRSRAVRFTYVAGGLALSWQWIASLCLDGACLLASSPWAFQNRKWPFLATFSLPVLVFVLMLLDVHRSQPKGSASPRDIRFG
jgi:hypothetical protein